MESDEDVVKRVVHGGQLEGNTSQILNVMCYLNDEEASLIGETDVPLQTLVTKREHHGRAQSIAVAVILWFTFELRVRLVST